jgi:pyrroloquinoline quinone biosynthesis protein D
MSARTATSAGIAAESRPRRRDRVLVQRAAGKQVLLNLDDGQYFALDEVSGRIWELCDGEHTVADVVAALCRDYDAPEETVAADVAAFLGELIDEKLLQSEA